MNKQEIEHKLEQVLKDRATICKGFTEEIGNLQEQLAEAEKPKLRHGDFGIEKSQNKAQFICFLTHNATMTAPEFIAYHEKNAGKHWTKFMLDSEYADGLTIFGNIFDLMKDWGKDLTEFEMEGPATNVKVEARGSFVAFIDPSDRNEINVSIEKIEEFWCKLGQLVMTLKKKQ